MSKEEFDYFDSHLLDIELSIQKEVIERNKNNPIIKLGFSDRFYSWVNNLLPDRFEQINREKSLEFINRMAALNINDFKRLNRRAKKEGLDKRDDLLNTLLLELSKYVNKKEEYSNDKF